MTGSSPTYPAVVADASVWVGNFLPLDLFHAASVLWVTQYAATGGAILAPAWLRLEVAAAVARRTRQRAAGKQAEVDLMAVPALRLLPVDDALLDDAIELATDLGLRAGDASYVALAQRLAIPLVTWDQEQAGRAGARVTVFAPDTFRF